MYPGLEIDRNNSGRGKPVRTREQIPQGYCLYTAVMAVIAASTVNTRG
jgi:hypothetical protein